MVIVQAVLLQEYAIFWNYYLDCSEPINTLQTQIQVYYKLLRSTPIHVDVSF